MSNLFKFDSDTVKKLVKASERSQKTAFVDRVAAEIDGSKISEYSMYSENKLIMEYLQNFINEGKSIPDIIKLEKFKDEKQIDFLVNCFNDGYDIKRFAHPCISANLMHTLKEADDKNINLEDEFINILKVDDWFDVVERLDNGVGVAIFDYIMAAVLSVIDAGCDYEWYSNWVNKCKIVQDYNLGQIMAILLGLHNGLDVAYYAHPDVPYEIMMDTIHMMSQKQGIDIKSVGFPEEIDRNKEFWYDRYIKLVTGRYETV